VEDFAPLSKFFIVCLECSISELASHFNPRLTVPPPHSCLCVYRKNAGTLLSIEVLILCVNSSKSPLEPEVIAVDIPDIISAFHSHIEAILVDLDIRLLPYNSIPTFFCILALFNSSAIYHSLSLRGGSINVSFSSTGINVLKKLRWSYNHG